MTENNPCLLPAAACIIQNGMKMLFLRVVSLFVLAGIAAAAQPPVGPREFSVQGEYREIASSRATITGHLPDGWEEDSAWADVEVHYRPQEINPFAGGRALRAVGRPAELLLHRVRTPRHWGRAAPDSPFGTHVPATESALRMAKALGFNWNRVHYGFNWNGLQNAEGAWNFEAADRILAAHAKQEMPILTHFGGVPPRFSVVGPNWEGANSWWRVTAAPRMDAMDTFEE